MLIVSQKSCYTYKKKRGYKTPGALSPELRVGCAELQDEGLRNDTSWDFDSLLEEMPWGATCATWDCDMNVSSYSDLLSQHNLVHPD